MAVKFTNHRDALRHTAGRVVIAVSLTIVLTLTLSLYEFGVDPNVMVHAGSVTESVILIGIVVSALLTAGLSYRSALAIRELTQARADLMRISCTDQLTGLLNRRGFDEAAAAALKEAKEELRPSSVLMCDIDHFKTINDRFGHEFGDKVLVAIADVFRSFAAERGRILVARHGGEEFAALMTGVSREWAALYAEDLREACAAKEILGEQGTSVTISIGLAVCTGETDLPKVMRLADQALYAAKHRGRDRVVGVDVRTETVAA